MAQMAIVKNIKGKFKLIDKNGKEADLKVGDILSLDDTLASLQEGSVATFVLPNGKEVKLDANEISNLSDNLFETSGSNSEALADARELQEALLNGGSLDDLEATAAGGGGTAAGGNGVSLGAAGFDESGSISNVTSNQSNISAQNGTNANATNVSATTFATGAATTADATVNTPTESPALDTTTSTTPSQPTSPVSPAVPDTTNTPNTANETTPVNNDPAQPVSPVVPPVAPAEPVVVNPPVESDTTAPNFNDSNIAVLPNGKVAITLPNDSDVKEVTANIGNDAKNSFVAVASKDENGNISWEVQDGKSGAEVVEEDGVKKLVITPEGVEAGSADISASATDTSDNKADASAEYIYAPYAPKIEGDDKEHLLITVPKSSYKDGEGDFKTAEATKEYTPVLDYKFADLQDKFEADVQNGWWISKDNSVAIAMPWSKKLIVTKEDNSSYDAQEAKVVKLAQNQNQMVIYGSDNADDILIDGVNVKAIYSGDGDDSINAINSTIGTIKSGAGSDHVVLDHTRLNDDYVAQDGNQESFVAKNGSYVWGSVWLKGTSGQTSITIDNSEVLDHVAFARFIKIVNGSKIGGSIQLGDSGFGGKITQEAKEIGFELSNHPKLSELNGGYVEIDGSKITEGIDTRGGDDFISIKNSEVLGISDTRYKVKKNYIDAGSGNDVIIIENSKIATQYVGSYSGADNITIIGGETKNIISGKDQRGSNNEANIVLDGVKVVGDVDIKSNGNSSIDVKNGSQVSGVINAGNGKDSVVVNGASNVSSIKTNGGNDNIQVLNNSNVSDINSGAGNDKINLVDSKVENTIFAGAGDDKVYLDNSKADNIKGYAGNNTIELSEGSVAQNIMGGSGNDNISLSNKSSAENIKGSEGNDVIKLSDGSSVKKIFGDAGSDVIGLDGKSKVNVISGNDGDDFIALKGGSSAGYIYGGNDDEAGNAKNVPMATGSDTILIDGYDKNADGAINLTYVKTGADNDSVLVKNSTLAGQIALGDGDDKLGMVDTKFVDKAKAYTQGGSDTIWLKNVDIEAGGAVTGNGGKDSIVLEGVKGADNSVYDYYEKIDTAYKDDSSPAFGFGSTKALSEAPNINDILSVEDTLNAKLGSSESKESEPKEASTDIETQPASTHLVSLDDTVPQS